ncbi:hypothetical protein PRK78_005316 [Emydomyces testavorans]|uniref:F-box domain-containing protein n=1 Tax=Emydomyces testavorans TaxID=2070801 RepID=A0AAF0DJF1_9EURO|nr:hypothetical protein PRK78_005316 [Emydomyces testavorans]
MPQQLSALQEHGETQYRLKNYAKALEAFSKAIELGRGDVLPLLDNRAATYCALGDLESGLKDGRRMIKADKFDARGYLRAAKVLQLMKKFDEALRLYKYSLRMLAADVPGRKQIETLMSKLERALNPPKRVDPLVTLPPELVSMILEYLDLKTTIRWLSFDLTIARRPVSYSAVAAFLRRSNGGVKEARLARINRDLVPGVFEMLCRCANLTSLEITNRQDINDLPLPITGLASLKSLIIDAAHRLETDHLFTILSCCARLERVKADNIQRSPGDYNNALRFPNLLSLELSWHNDIRYSPMNPFVLPLFSSGELEVVMPNLEVLSLAIHVPSQFFMQAVSIPTHPKLQKFTYKNLYLQAPPKLPSTLEHLLFENVIIKSPPQTNPLSHFSNLKTAVFWTINLLMPDILESLVSQNKETLTHLSIRWCSGIAADDLEPLMVKGLFHSINTLDIAGIRNVTDATTPIIIANMPNLKTLDLSGTRITGFTVKQLADAENPKLERLIVPQIGMDAIEYGRSRHIQITRS